MPVLHAPHFPLFSNVLFPQTVWTFEGWPSIHIYCYNSLLLSPQDLCWEDNISFLCLAVNQVTLCQHFFDYSNTMRILAFRSALSPFRIPVDFGRWPENISEVNNVLNEALTWLHFTRGAKYVLNHFRHQKQHHLVFAFSFCLFDELMQHLHHLHPMIHECWAIFILSLLFLMIAMSSTMFPVFWLTAVWSGWFFFL